MLEPYAGKLARTVLRGGSGGDAAPLPDLLSSQVNTLGNSMTTLRSALPMALMLLLVGCSPEETKATNKEKIIGVWEVTKATRSSVSPGDMWEFTKDGEMVLTPTVGKGLSIAGKYTVEGDMLTPTTVAISFAAVGPSKVTRLNEMTLVLEAEVDGKNDTIELKRKK
jgi:uncharacterized protein (TIGR03066 family)